MNAFRRISSFEYFNRLKGVSASIKIQSLARRSRSALAITETELKLMAAAAKTG